jgi:hypothetical protein
MTEPLFQRTKLQEAFAALRRDLIHEDGPRIKFLASLGLPRRPNNLQKKTSRWCYLRCTRIAIRTR